MKKPSVTVENAVAVYDYYNDNPINLPFTRTAHALFGTILQNHTTWENPPDQVADWLQDDGQIILAANHISDHDQFVVASLPAQQDALQPLIGNTFIPSKAGLFKNPFTRYAIDQLGAIPTFRAADVTVDWEQRQIVTDLFLDVCKNRMNRGQHMAIFPESTRNKAQPEKVQRLKRGIGEIACGVDVQKIMILPVGIRIDQAKRFGYIKPRVHIDKPLVGPFTAPEEVLEALAPRMQHAVDVIHTS